jgi:hypothetical protein
MTHTGNDTTEKSNQAIKRTNKVHGVIEHIEKEFQKYSVPGKNIAIDKSTVVFRGKIIYQTYNPKKLTKWGIRLFVLADSDTGYVHSIIPYYGKLTDDMYKLSYSKKTFNFKNSFFLDGQTRTLCV